MNMEGRLALLSTFNFELSTLDHEAGPNRSEQKS
jgi:hypothetical protein